MRTRTRGMLDRAWYSYQDYNPPSTGGGKTYDTGTVFTNSKSNGSYDTVSDVIIPNFLRRKNAGEVFMNPFTVTKDKRSTSSSSFTFGTHPGWGTRKVNGDLACIWSVPPSRPSWFETRKTDAMARTLLMAHSKVASEDFMSLVTVAEATKTARMIARPFGAATDLINRMIARRAALVVKGLTLTAAATQAWLEYRFGWKPLLYEMQGIREAYVNNLVQYDKPVRLVARASDGNIVWDLPNSVTTASASAQGVTSVTMRANYSHRAKVSSGVLYELKDDTLESATARRMGLRLSDVPASLWELVPLSFVVDRFVDVGAWLSAIVPKPGVNVLGSWTTVIDYQLNFHEIMEAKIVVNTPPATTYTNSGGTFSEEIQSVSRTANPTIPSVPTVNYRDLNLTQQIDHVALITQRLLGLRVGNARI